MSGDIAMAVVVRARVRRIQMIPAAAATHHPSYHHHHLIIIVVHLMSTCQKMIGCSQLDNPLSMLHLLSRQTLIHHMRPTDHCHLLHPSHIIIHQPYHHAHTHTIITHHHILLLLLPLHHHRHHQLHHHINSANQHIHHVYLLVYHRPPPPLFINNHHCHPPVRYIPTMLHQLLDLSLCLFLVQLIHRHIIIPTCIHHIIHQQHHHHHITHHYIHRPLLLLLLLLLLQEPHHKHPHILLCLYLHHIYIHRIDHHQYR
jgi:hypothetical protein